MGVLNVTPDSFSDGGVFLEADRALARAQDMIDAGADIIDIGGESSRPGAAPVSVEEELRRVISVVQKLSVISDQLSVRISVDTTKSAVAREALAAGAHIINDISALRFDPEMAGVVRDARAGVILMHLQGDPATMQIEPRYRDVVADVRAFLSDRIAFAESEGIPPAAIAIDPGIGFGKNLEHNLQLLAALDAFTGLGRPLVVGTSRKAFIGKVLKRETPDRIWGTAATVAWAVAHNARVVRVHDVAEMSDVVRMIEAIRGAVEKDSGKLR